MRPELPAPSDMGGAPPQRASGRPRAGNDSTAKPARKFFGAFLQGKHTKNSKKVYLGEPEMTHFPGIYTAPHIGGAQASFAPPKRVGRVSHCLGGPFAAH